MAELVVSFPKDDFDNFHLYKDGSGCARMVRTEDLPAEEEALDAFLRDMAARASDFAGFPCEYGAGFPFGDGVILRFGRTREFSELAPETLDNPRQV